MTKALNKTTNGPGMKRPIRSILAAGAVAAVLGGILAVLGGILMWQADASETVPLSRVSHIHGIAVDRQDPSRLYLATHHGVWRTAPDGTAERVSADRSDYMGFTPHPIEPATFYASGHPEGGGNLGVLVSRDGGRSWTQVARGVNGSVDFHAMDVSPADPHVIYGLYGGVQVSRDGGKSWTITGTPPADIFDLAADPQEPDTVYAASRNGLMVSRDGARTWRAATVWTRPASLVQGTPDGTVYAFVVGVGLVKRSGPSGSWETVSDGFGDRVLLHLAADPADRDRLFVVTQHSEILASADGGRTWTRLSQGSGQRDRRGS